MQEVFDIEYRDDIVFGEIYYLRNWDCVDKSTSPRYEVMGFFDDMYTKDRNYIWLLDHNPIKDIKFDRFYDASALVHEYAHFFTKKAGFNEEFDGVTKLYDIGLIEAVAYYIQDLWLKENAGYSLLSYYPEVAQSDVLEYFDIISSPLYRRNYEDFLVSALRHFEENAPEKFDKAVSKKSVFFPAAEKMLLEDCLLPQM